MYVLVVDDNEINGRVYERIVKRLAGAICCCFSRPGEALAWSSQELPELVVVDYSMPDIDGIEFVRAFRRIPGREAIPIIMITALIDNARLRDEALDAGVNTFFPKPVSPDRFLKEARRLMGVVSKEAHP